MMSEEKEKKAQRITELTTALQDAVQRVEAGTEITAKRMFGGAGYYADGLLFAMWYGEGLALKLAEEDRETLMEIPGAATAQNPANIETPESFLSQPQLLAPWVQRSLAYVRSKKSSLRSKE